MKRLLVFFTILIFCFLAACSPIRFYDTPDADVSGETAGGGDSDSDSDSDGSSAGSEQDDDSATSSGQNNDEDIIWTSLAAVDWTVAWTGYGQVVFDDDGVMLEPKRPDVDDELHSALVLLNDALTTPVIDFKITLSVTNQEQLQPTTPEAWEVFWLLFNFSATEDYDTRTFNYFVLKTNGVELGVYENYGVEHQTFLATESEPQAIIGVANEWVIEKIGQNLSAWIDGALVMTFDGAVEEEPLLDQAGTFGLYTEDARVRVHSVEILPY
ncbi:MAG: hypothetical protein ABII18_07765 [bacterium]|nr:hypothetical protein [bacterium]MBU1917522.1 hypothetical protein [bacterium]